MSSPEPNRARYVVVFLTPYAPGVAPDAPVGGEGRTVQQFGVTPARAVEALLQRLGRRPDQVVARALEAGDVALIGRVPADAPKYLSPGSLQPLAFVIHGLSATEITNALAVLATAGAAAAA